MQKQLLRAVALAAAVLLVFVLPRSMPRVDADPGHLARTEYGYRLAPQSTVPPNCTNPDRQCLWVNTADRNLYLHKTDGSDTPLGGPLAVPGRLTTSNSDTDGLCFIDSGGSAKLCLSSNSGTTLASSSSLISLTLGPIGLISGSGNGGALAFLGSAQGNNAAGGSGLQISQLPSGQVNDTFYALTTGGNAYGDGISVVAATTCAAGDVLVWSGSKQVSRSGATTNLPTVAGIASTACAVGQRIKMVVRGLALVSADAGITAGQTVGTSSTLAGRVQAASPPPASATIGRAIEATGGTVANFVLVSVDLG